VKKLFLSPEVFDLQEGKLSTKDESRRLEFIEEARKKGRRADVVIFIENDVVIPVEIERLGNITAGISQLFQYQKDWRKKYGILTDGNEWRLYRSSQYKAFFIDEILDNPKDFLAYWQFYIKPENYYIELFNTDSQKNLFNDKLDLNVAENRVTFFDEITQLIVKFKSKMSAIGVFEKDLSKREE